MKADDTVVLSCASITTAVRMLEPHCSILEILSDDMFWISDCEKDITAGGHGNRVGRVVPDDSDESHILLFIIFFSIVGFIPMSTSLPVE
jgi:hypothetical protein